MIFSPLECAALGVWASRPHLAKEPQTDAVLSDMNFDGKTDARDAAKILSVYSETLADAE